MISVDKSIGPLCIFHNSVVPYTIILFEIGEKKYVSNENIDLIRKMCENMSIEYQGQGVGTLLLECVKQATGNERLPKSTHNPYVFETLLKANKDRVHYGFINNIQDLKDCEAWDLIKDYASCLYEPSEEWIVIDYNDTWEDYDGELKLGIYYITTEDTMLFKKNGYYTTCKIKKALQESIEFLIEKQLKILMIGLKDVKKQK
jgi:hypothetical protein